jgi:HAD superfamily hydrolase (TIGR01490 family)
MRKLALFDFCETLVSFQTAGEFVNYVRRKAGSPQMLRLEKIRILSKKLRFTAVANKLFPHYNFDKRLQLYQLKGFTKDALEILAGEYYLKFIEPNLIPELIGLVKEKLEEGYTVSIVSGGYSIYLNHFAREYGVTDIISSEIEFDAQQVCTGRLKGKDCMYHYKIQKLIQHYVAGEIDLTKSVAYSDSITDLPLLTWAGTGVVVSAEKSQSWAKVNGLTEIIFKKRPTTDFQKIL